MRGSRLNFEKPILHHRFDRDTFPHGIELAPARHAVDIHLNFRARQLAEFIPRPTFFFIHLTPYAEIPRSRVKVRDRPIMQNREFQCERLPGWKTTLASDALLLLAAIRTFKR